MFQTALHTYSKKYAYCVAPLCQFTFFEWVSQQAGRLTQSDR